MADEDYNPYDHRTIAKPISNCDAFFSLLRCVVGTGILAMPMSLHFSGVIPGLVLTILSAILLVYGMQLLIGNMTEACKRMKQPQATYPETMAFAFSEGPKWCRHLSKPAGITVFAVLGFSHFGICVVYLVFVATNFKQVIDFYFEKTEFYYYILLFGVLTIPLFLIRHLKYLVPFIMIGNICMYCGFLAIFYYVFRGLPPIEKIQLFQEIDTLPLFFGIILFSLTSVGVMIMIETQMKNPGAYLGIFGVMDQAMVVVVITSILFAFFGYWRYGDDIQGSITLNIPEDEIPSQCIKVAIAIAIFCTYPLSGGVTIDILINGIIYANREKKSNWVEYVLRLTFVVLTMVLGIVFPNLGPLLALVGSLTISVLNLIFPAIINMCMFYKKGYGRVKYRLIKDIFIIIIGIAILLLGSWRAIVQMVDEYGTT